MRLSDYVIQYLKTNYNVDVIFTISGGGCIYLVDSLTNVPGIKYIATHHEQVAALAAEGYARLHGKLGACLVTSGPGSTNTLTGVLCAWTDSIPIIVLSGQVNRNMTTRFTGSPLRQLGDQELDIVDVVKSITKYAVQINDPNEIKYHLDKACTLATTGKPGPVWIDIPLDVQSATIDPDTLAGYDLHPHVPCVSSEQLELIAEKLNKAKKPLLIVGNGIRLSAAIKELYQFLEKTNIPVISAVNGNDLVNEDYRGYAGRFGTHAQICANTLLNECDFLLSVGSRLYVRQTGYDFEGFAKNAYKVYVDIELDELKKQTLFPDMAVHSDAKLFLDGLATKAINPVDNGWLQHCSDKFKNTPKVLEKHRNNKCYVSNYHFIEKLNEHTTDTDHIVTSDGCANVITMQVVKLRGSQRLITNTGAAPMGYGLPAAIGAASTGVPIICIEGDGSLHLNIHELQTMKHYQLPIRLILLNNQGYSSIKMTQRTYFNGKFVAAEKNSGVSFPNFEKIMTAYELPYACIKYNHEIEDVLKSFLSQKGPCVLEVFTDPDEAHEPKVPAKVVNGKLFPGNLHSIKWLEE